MQNTECKIDINHTTFNDTQIFTLHTVLHYCSNSKTDRRRNKYNLFITLSKHFFPVFLTHRVIHGGRIEQLPESRSHEKSRDRVKSAALNPPGSEDWKREPVFIPEPGSWKDPSSLYTCFPIDEGIYLASFPSRQLPLTRIPHGSTSRNFSRRKLLPSIVSIHRPLNLLSARRKETRSCALSPRRLKGEGEVLLMENRLKAVWAKNLPSKLRPSLWTRHNESLERVSTNIKCPVFPLFLRCLRRIFLSRECSRGRGGTCPLCIVGTM